MELLIFKGGVSIIVSKIKQLQVKINGDSEEDINSSIPLLIEVVSIAKRMYAYIEEKKNDTENIKTKGDSFIESHSNENDKMMLEELIDILQSLLKTNNNVLLICIIELLVSIVSNKRNLHKFRDETVLENILNVLNIVEDTEVKKRALYLLIELVQDEDIVDILKGVHFLDILAHLIEQSRLINIHNEENDESNDQTQDIKIGYWDLLKILSANKHDILPEFRRLHIIETLLDELEISKNIFHQITLLEILINLSMDDQSSLQIRECGIHIIGKKLLYTSESVDENDRSLKMLKKNWSSNADFKVYLKQFINEIQQLSLMLLRFLYSMQKNRKVFRLLFPPEIFGPFIDIGNYERNRDKYKLVKKINRLSEGVKLSIMGNFEKIRDIAAGIAENQKFVNGYKIIDIIGKGAFGIVYEVEKDGMRFAMKKIEVSQYDHTYEHIKNEDIIEENKDSDSQVGEKICKEISILKGVDHPNIVKFYTSFVEDECVYIIMELHEGMSLADYIQSLSEKKQKVKEETAWNIFFQLCSALRYLHYDVRILHRDFAPSNILLDENFTVKLIDFGLATKWGTQSASANKSFVGTILYSCPEMVQNKKLTVKADVWSLGAIMYEFLTLEQPFKGDNPLLIANNIVKCQYKPIPQDEYSEDLIGVIEKCLTVETKNRPNIVELCEKYTTVMLKQMDAQRLREISLLNKIKMLERSRGNFSKLSNTHAIDLNLTNQYNSASPMGKHHENVLKTGGFENKGSQFKIHRIVN